MSALVYLIPISILLGTVALIAFLWSLKHGQYEDLEGAALRILTDQDTPLPPVNEQGARSSEGSVQLGKIADISVDVPGRMPEQWKDQNHGEETKSQSQGP